MGEVREENQRLRMYLDKIMKDYKTLEMQFLSIVRQESKESPENAGAPQIEEPEFVSLSLGRATNEIKRDEKNKNNTSKGKENEEVIGSLSLGLDCKFELSKISPSEASVLNSSLENSLGGQKEDAGDAWPPGKLSKTMRTGDEESSQQNPPKRARVSVRARCDTPTVS